MSPYSAEISSNGEIMRVSYTCPMPLDGLPLMVYELNVSKVPVAKRRSVPPFGAVGFT